MNKQVPANELKAHLASQDLMPRANPLQMPTQDFRRPFHDPSAPTRPKQANIWGKRAMILLPSALITAALAMVFAAWVGQGRMHWLDIFWVTLASTTFFWISFAFSLSISGLFGLGQRYKPKPSKSTAPTLNVAILMPIHNEDVEDVFANLRAMQIDLNRHHTQHQFSFFVLSDTQDPEIAAKEGLALERMRNHDAQHGQVFYRRRDKNTGYKAGNIRQWVRCWGGGYDAMLVLDADSLMSAKAIHRLTETLADNPDIGLIQGALRVFRSRRLFARLQQFSNIAFGALPANGLNLWSGSEGNYFGHNAIMRTKAFAACAGLPNLKAGRNREVPIMSHDFVEAALMRRAGWGIKLMPDLQDSYEQAPETLIDYIQRDKRWCRGNMQHLRIMTSAGLHPISRFHMFFNALGFLMSPIWLMLILLWVFYGQSLSNSGGHAVANTLILPIVFAMLLTPKFISAGMILLSHRKRRLYGGFKRFAGSFLAELAISILVAPIFMIHHSVTIFTGLFGINEPWKTPIRTGIRHSWNDVLRFHALEACLGSILLLGILTGFATVYLLPIALGLAAAPLLSYLSSVDCTGASPIGTLFSTNVSAVEPQIISSDEFENLVSEAERAASSTA